MIENFRRMRAPRRLDGQSSPAFEQEITRTIEGGDILLVLDLGQLEFISSAGLRVLLTAGKKVKAAGGRLALCSLHKPIQEAFDISGYTVIFDVFPTYDAAVAHLAMR